MSDNGENNNISTTGKLKGIFSTTFDKVRDEGKNIVNKGKSELDERRRKSEYKKRLNSGKNEIYLMQYQKAEAQLIKGIEILKQKPDLMSYSLEALYFLGWIYGHYEQNKQKFKSIMEELDKQFDVAQQGKYGSELRGILYYLDGEFKNAMSEMFSVVTKKDASFISKLYFGLSCYEIKNYKDALKYLYNAIQEEPDHIIAHQKIGDLYSFLEKPQRAKIHYDIVYLLEGE